MTLFSHPYVDDLKTGVTRTSRLRTGGPRRRRPATSRQERRMYAALEVNMGSHMPLDTGAHWEWRNPLNLLPALLLLFLLLALVAMV